MAAQTPVGAMASSSVGSGRHATVSLLASPPLLPAPAPGRRRAHLPTGRSVSETRLTSTLQQPWQPAAHCRRLRLCCQSSSSGGGGSGGGGPQQERLQNLELLIGDCLCLLCFALYKQARGCRQGSELLCALLSPPGAPSVSAEQHPGSLSAHDLEQRPGWLSCFCTRCPASA